eukprot:XP_028343232.1 uncharacterized protein LOC114485637 [Physeter catodon]
MAATSNNLTDAEQAFLVYDWAKSEKWQSYLMNLYPVPPQNKILKWKIKFFKAQENADLNPESPAFAAALAEQNVSGSCARQAAAAQPSHSSTSSWSQLPNACSREARSRSAFGARVSTLRKKTLPSLCVLGLVLGVSISFSAVTAEKAASGAFTYSAAGTLLLFFSFLTHLYIVLGKPPFRLTDLSGAMSSAFASYLQQAVVQDSTHAMLYLLFTSTMPRSFPALFSPTLSAVLVICSLVAAGDGIPAFICRMPLLRGVVQKIQAEVRDAATSYRLVETRQAYAK